MASAFGEGGVLELDWAQAPAQAHSRELGHVEHMLPAYYASKPVADLATAFLEQDLAEFGYERLHVGPVDDSPREDIRRAGR